MADPQNTALRGDVVVPVVVACAGAAFCLFQIGVLVPEHDSAYLLALAGEMLRGGRYFYDFLEINPPLYSLLLIPAQGLHAFAGLPLYSCFIVWISILITASAAAVGHLLRSLLDEGIVGRLLLAIAAEAALFFLPGLDFGQRDHLCCVLILPAVVWMAANRHATPMTATGWLIAVAATLGVLIKPHLLLVMALAYALRMLEEGTWRVVLEPPVWCAALLAALYAGLLVLVFPEWFKVVKIANVAYAGYDAGAWIGRRTIEALALLAVLAAANEVFARRSTRERRFGRYLAVATLGSLGSFIVQHKGIDYQFIPTKLLISLFAGWVALMAAGWAATTPALAALQRPAGFLRRYRAIVIYLVAIVPLTDIVGRVAVDGDRLNRSMVAFAAVLNAKAIGPRIAVFGSSVYPAYPLALYRPSQPAWRFTHPWLIPWIVQQQAAGGGKAPQVAEMEALQRSMVLEDFRRFEPDAILRDESPRKLGLPPTFDMMSWFREEPAMAAILDRYERVGEFDDPNIKRYFSTRFGIYRRRAN
jgi:hypothetical protein